MILLFNKIISYQIKKKDKIIMLRKEMPHYLKLIMAKMLIYQNQ
jgi:hypothetical protein